VGDTGGGRLLDGLDERDVADRRARGLTNDVPEAPTRTVEEIIRANLLTPFNFLLGGLLVVILVVGPLNDALFGFVLVSNALVGIVQELRAKRTLDRLTLLSAPRARVVRSGQVQEVPLGDVVLDDLLELRPGDQVVVDARVVASEGLEIDESLLTGESDPVVKEPGDDVLSGSFVAAGRGRCRATRVGREAYAVQLAEEARRFTLVRSELRQGIDLIIRLVSWAMLPTAALLLFSQLDAHDGVHDAIRSTVGGVVAMVPEGLVLLTSIAFAAGVVRLGRRRALVQELPAVETLARVDVVCVATTGTLTKGDVTVHHIEPVAATDAPLVPIAALAAADPDPNATLLAIADAVASVDRSTCGAPTATAAFSSARKWGGATFDARTWVVGAPEVVLTGTPGDNQPLRDRVEAHADEGRRVVLVASSPSALDGDTLPSDLTPEALVLLDDELRPEAPDTLRFFAAEGVTVKVISGDHPRTVEAVARRAGMAIAGGAVDARELPDDPEALGDAMEANDVFGRVTPHQKRAMVAALQRRGHVVAMTGDGVNDVLALKDADIGIAMGSGSPASRAAAQLVLLDGSFATLPHVVGEGRRVINNIERVAHLFLTKTVYSMLLALAIGVAGLPFPLLPRHLTLVGSVTIGIPAFFLALAPNAKRARSGFVPRVLRFAAPAGTLAASATFGAYYLARNQSGVSLDEARTTATLVLVGVGLLVLIRLAFPLTTWRMVLIVTMVTVFLFAIVTPQGREFFALDLPPAVLVVAAIGIVFAAERMMRLAEVVTTRWRARH
jgi:cation-transporting ATPase E